MNEQSELSRRRRRVGEGSQAAGMDMGAGMDIAPGACSRRHPRRPVQAKQRRRLGTGGWAAYWPSTRDVR